jgi:hypothetical protein
VEAEGLLTTLAEVAIAIAGFSGIVVAVNRSNQPWSRVDKSRLTMLLQISFGCVFWSFLPILFHLAHVPEASIWFWSSGLWLIFIFGTVGYRLRQLPGAGDLHEDPTIKRVLLFIFVSLVIAIAAQVANVVWLRTPWPYVLAIMEGLLVASVFFVRLLRRIVGPVA